MFMGLFISSLLLKAIDSYVPALFHVPPLMHNDIARLMQSMHGSALTVFLIVCIGAPVLEETICRLPLSFKPRHISLGLSLAALFASGFKLKPEYFMSGNFVVPLLIASSVYGIVQTYLGNPDRYAAERLSLNTKRGFIIFSILLFGFMHITNYQPLHYQVWFLYPLYVMPQILMGWCLSYVRLRNGVAYSMLLHGLTNSVPFLVFLIGHHH